MHTPVRHGDDPLSGAQVIEYDFADVNPETFRTEIFDI